MKPWIGVDLDGTLAHMGTGHFDGSIGEPIPSMVDMVRDFLSAGWDVKIFTARVSPKSRHNGDGTTSVSEQISMVKEWTKKYIGQELDVTCEKDYGMHCLYDDRARQVLFNQGVVVSHENAD